MSHIGGGFQILGLLAGTASVIFYAAGLRTGRSPFRSYGDLQKVLMFVFLAVAAAILCSAVFSNDFSLRYVSLYSDRTLPAIYKISVLWAGQSGGMLTACLVAAFCCMAETRRLKKAEEKYACAVNLVSGVFCCVLLAFAIFIASPFVELDFIPVNGSGLFPSFQNKYIFSYPILIYFCMAGALVIFSHASAALVTKDLSPYWLCRSRPWIYATWLSAAAALVVRGLWSYAMKGVFWNWSVREMAAILVLLSLTALMHVSAAYEKRGRMKPACFLYAALVFEAALFCFYLMNTGADNVIKPFGYTFYGFYIVAAMLFSFVFFMLALAANGRGFKAVQRSGASPGCAGFRTLNIGFLAVIFFVFAGLLFQITAGGDSQPGRYYLFVMVPVGFFTVYFIAAGRFYPFLRGGRRFFRHGAKCVREAGSAAAHTGFILLIAAASLSSVYKQNGELTLYPGEYASFKDYGIKLNCVKSMQKDNYVSTFVDISLSSGEKMIGNIYPEIRGYNNSNRLIAETKSVVSGLGVVSVAFLSYDFSSKEARLLVMDRPFVLIAVPGFLLLIFGAMRAMGTGRNG